MKNYIKGIITGIIIGAVICSIPALADTIDALFNNVRISVNGVDQIQWGENIKLSDGAETPASILVGGTTYLPMRKLGELSGNKIYWNGDSRTVGMTGAQKDIKIIAEKPDKNGNVWEYYTFTSNVYNEDSNMYYDRTYLGVRDKTRGYERVYQIADAFEFGENIYVTDDAIYFVRTKLDYDFYKGELTKLSFENDADTQDGEIIESIYCVGSVAFVDNIVYYSTSFPHTNSDHTVIVAYDYLDRKATLYTFKEHYYARNIKIESNDGHTTLNYELTRSIFKEGDYAIDFDKNAFTFGEPYEINE